MKNKSPFASNIHYDENHRNSEKTILQPRWISDLINKVTNKEKTSNSKNPKVKEKKK